MAYKKCSICKKSKGVSFNKNSRKKDGLQSSCRTCNKKSSASYYKRKTEEHKIVTRQNKIIIRTRNSQYIWDYLLTHPCVDCGNSNPIVLDFDHVRGTKIAPVSVLARDSYSLDSLLEEIAKCEVRCSNCHRIKTADQLGWYKNINTGSSPNGMAPDF